MLGVSDQAGYQLVAEASDADVIVVNTCGFIEAAKQESIDTIFELAQWKEQGRCAQDWQTCTRSFITSQDSRTRAASFAACNSTQVRAIIVSRHFTAIRPSCMST